MGQDSYWVRDGRPRISCVLAPNQRSRLVAGYCWDWASKKDAAAHDIVFPEHDFRMRWNLAEDGGLWRTSSSATDAS